MRKLEFSAHADRDMDQVFDYTVDQWGFEQAFRYSDELIAVITKLGEFPHLGIDRSDLQDRLRCLVVARHVVWYRVFAERVLVSRVLHEREDAVTALVDVNY